MKQNINTEGYWEKRFSSGDWERQGGRCQTKGFARFQLEYLQIPPDFGGTILDFGCGLGDAIPIYKDAFPKAKLIGVDFSKSAIRCCQKAYGKIGTFIQGSHITIPHVDVIISSNVFEHLSNDIEIAEHLLSKCEALYVIVPYKEQIPSFGSEHVNSYDENYYKPLGSYKWTVFPSRGWSQYGFDLWRKVYFKNIFRFILGKRVKHRDMQIMFYFSKKRANVSNDSISSGSTI